MSRIRRKRKIFMILGILIFLLSSGILLIIPTTGLFASNRQALMNICMTNQSKIIFALYSYKYLKGSFPESLSQLTDAELIKSLPLCPLLHKNYRYILNGNGKSFILSCSYGTPDLSSSFLGMHDQHGLHIGGNQGVQSISSNICEKMGYVDIFDRVHNDKDILIIILTNNGRILIGTKMLGIKYEKMANDLTRIMRKEKIRTEIGIIKWE